MILKILDYYQQIKKINYINNISKSTDWINIKINKPFTNNYIVNDIDIYNSKVESTCFNILCVTESIKLKSKNILNNINSICDSTSCKFYDHNTKYELLNYYPCINDNSQQQVKEFLNK